jgi:hypothetical protein
VRDGTFVGVPVQTNSFGHRDREIPTRKPPNGFRVVAVGDSVTFGHGVRVEDAWPERLERRLAARLPVLQVDVVNTAVPGNSPFQEYADLERALPLEPDAVVIQFVLNDVVEPYKVFRRYGGKGRDYHGVDDVPYWDWELSQRSAFYLFLKDVAARIRFGTLTREGVRQNAVREEVALSWEAAADAPDDPAVLDWRECLAWMQREVDLCERHGIPCCCWSAARGAVRRVADPRSSGSRSSPPRTTSSASTCSRWCATARRASSPSVTRTRGGPRGDATSSTTIT